MWVFAETQLIILKRTEKNPVLICKIYIFSYAIYTFIMEKRTSIIKIENGVIMKEEYKEYRQFLKKITEKNKEEIKLKIKNCKQYNGQNLLFKVLTNLNSNYYFIGKWKSDRIKKDAYITFPLKNMNKNLYNLINYFVDCGMSIKTSKPFHIFTENKILMLKDKNFFIFDTFNGKKGPYFAANIKKIDLTLEFNDIYNIKFLENCYTEYSSSGLDYNRKKTEKAKREYVFNINNLGDRTTADFLSKYFEILSKENYVTNKGIMKDIAKDLKKEKNQDGFYHTRIVISYLKNSYNRKDLISKAYDNIPDLKIFNKLSIFQSDTFLEHYDKVVEESKKILLQNLDILKPESTHDSRGNFLYNIILKNCNYPPLVEDYLTMCDISDIPVRLDFKGMKGLKKEHDRVQKIYSKQEIIIKEDNKFLKLEFPDNFERLDTWEKLEEESRKNNNCVWSYSDFINMGECMCYGFDYNERHYTLEIRQENKKYYIHQLKGYGNSNPTEDVYEYVNNTINEAIKQKRG